ncbi:hypothetical protein JMUB7545_27570 [Staphylococcus aureus]
MSASLVGSEMCIRDRYSDKHYVAYLYDESKAVKITKGSGSLEM